MQVFVHPKERLQIAQTAFALFYIWLNHVALSALLAVPLGPFLKFGFNEFGRRGLKEVSPKLVAQFIAQCLISADIALLNKRGTDGEIFAAKSDTVRNGPAGLANFQTQIPQHVEHRFNRTLGPSCDFGGGEKQQIHV